MLATAVSNKMESLLKLLQWHLPDGSFHILIDILLYIAFAA